MASSRLQLRRRPFWVYIFLTWVLISLGLIFTTVSSLAQVDQPAIPRTAEEARLKLENSALFKSRHAETARNVLLLNFIQGAGLLVAAIGVWRKKKWSVPAYSAALLAGVLSNIVSEGRQSALLIGVVMLFVLAWLWKYGQLT